MTHEFLHHLVVDAFCVVLIGCVWFVLYRLVRVVLYD